MNQPSISIVIPAFNEAKNIEPCIKAIRPQLKDGDELIVVDNNSIDATTKLAKQCGAIVLYEGKQGISYARNKGFNSAKNPIIARTDADTIIGEDWLDSIREYYQQEDLQDNAVGGPVYLKEFLPLRLGVHQGLTKKMLGHETLIGGNFALSKSLWDKVKGRVSNDDSMYAEDMELAILITKSGGQVEFLPSMIVATSARWMIRHPIHSLTTWRAKTKQTKRLQF